MSAVRTVPKKHNPKAILNSKKHKKRHIARQKLAIWHFLLKISKNSLYCNGVFLCSNNTYHQSEGRKSCACGI